MRRSATTIGAALFAAGLTAHAAAAQPAGEAMATAPARDAAQIPDMTQAQIDAFINGPTVAPVVVTAKPRIDNSPWAQGLYTPVTPGIDAAKVARAAEVKPVRQMHGEVGGVIGSNGLRGGYAAVSLPVGDTATVHVAVSDVQYGRRR